MAPLTLPEIPCQKTGHPGKPSTGRGHRVLPMCAGSCARPGLNLLLVATGRKRSASGREPWVRPGPHTEARRGWGELGAPEL